MLHQWTELAPEFFREGIEAEYFRSYDELKQKIDYYLTHQAERAAIARAGYDRFIECDYGMVGQVKKLLEYTGLSPSHFPL